MDLAVLMRSIANTVAIYVVLLCFQIASAGIFTAAVAGGCFTAAVVRGAIYVVMLCFQIARWVFAAAVAGGCFTAAVVRFAIYVNVLFNCYVKFFE